MFPCRNFGYSRFVLIVSVAFLVFGVVSAAKKLDSRWSGPTGVITNSFLAKSSASPEVSKDKQSNRINVSSLKASSERRYGVHSMASALDPNRNGMDSQAQFSLANTQASLALALHISPSAAAFDGAPSVNPLLITAGTSTRAIAFDAVTFSTEPFSPATAIPWALDPNDHAT